MTSTAEQSRKVVTPPKESRRRVKTPEVRQMEMAECGAAALTMVLNYYENWVPLEEVREACGVSRDGVNAGKIVTAAQLYGLSGKAFRHGVRGVYKMEPPFIVFWEQNHFLVVEGFSRDKAYLNDPAFGRRNVDIAEFDSKYSRVALEFRPGPDFQRDSGRKPRPVLEMLRLLTRARLGLVLAVICGLAMVVPTTVAAMLLSLFTTQVLGADATNEWLSKIIIVGLVALILQFLLMLMQQRILLRLQTKLAIRMSATFLWKLIRLRSSFFDARSPGGLVSRMQLNLSLANLLSGELAGAFIGTIEMVLYLVVMLILDWRLALVTLVIASINVIALVSVSGRRVSANNQLQHAAMNLAGQTFLGIRLIDDIKTTGSEAEFFGKWSGTQAGAVNVTQRLGSLTQFLLIVPTFIATISTLAVLGVGGVFILNGTMTVGQLLAFQVILGSFLAPLRQLVTVSSEFQDARSWTAQINDVLAQPTDPLAPDPGETTATPASTAPPAPTGGAQPTRGIPRVLDRSRLAGYLELQNVSFGYVPGEPPLIRDLSVTLRPGERVAFVGTTGSGKSTVANLVTGLLSPWSGQILFDGRARDQIPREVLAASMAKVDQNIRLFSGTIADNVRFWDDTVPLTDLVQAVKDAQLEAEISAKPGGLGHQLEEDGRNLSGGQRQRLEIARALATKPSIVVLDEATSALDAIVEQRIDDSLRRRGCTCLIIAHRLSTIRDCDQIIVMDRGIAVQRGTHEELISVEGTYRELIGGE